MPVTVNVHVNSGSEVWPNGADARSDPVEMWQTAVVGAGGPPWVKSARSTLRTDTPPAVAGPDAVDPEGRVDEVVVGVVAGDEDV